MATPVSPKVTYPFAGGAAVTVVAWVLTTFAGVEVPTEVGMAVTVLLMSFFGWASRDPLRDLGAADETYQSLVKRPEDNPPKHSA